MSGSNERLRDERWERSLGLRYTEESGYLELLIQKAAHVKRLHYYRTPDGEEAF
jgi:hypothetical protein